MKTALPVENLLVTDAGCYPSDRLEQQIDRCSTMLCELGVKRVGIYSDNGSEWLIADRAISKAKISCIPLPLFFSEQQILHCCSQANIDAILTDNMVTLNKIPHTFSPLNTDTSQIQILLNKQAHNTNPLLTKTEELVTKVTFTSGTTGQPKGVLLTQPAINQVVQSLAAVLQPLNLQRHLCLLPLSVLLEDIAGAQLSTYLGGTLIAPSLHTLGLSGSNGINREKFATALNHYQPHSIVLLPELLRVMTLLAEARQIKVDSFRFIAVGGGIVSPEWLRRARNAGLPVYEGYGLSECASVVTLNAPGQDRPGTTGKVLPHQTLKIENGEIIVEGHGFSGYLNDNDSLAALSGKIYTGDEGFLDEEGYLHIQGRKKHIIINSFGRNINPEWPESKLLECPQILQAAVSGEGKPHLQALIVGLAQHHSVIEQHIIKINQQLPDYAQIYTWTLVDPDEFALMNLLTPNGRIKRNNIHPPTHNEVSHAIL